MRVAVYVRTAACEGNPSPAIVRQLELLQQYIGTQDWVLPEGNIFIDDGYSGSTPDRPGLDRLHAKAKSGQLDCVWLTEPYRLSRSYRLARLLWKELESNGCQVRYLNEVMD